MAAPRSHKQGLAKIIIPVKVYGTEVMGLIDSGCSQTLMKEKVVEISITDPWAIV